MRYVLNAQKFRLVANRTGRVDVQAIRRSRRTTSPERASMRAAYERWLRASSLASDVTAVRQASAPHTVSATIEGEGSNHFLVQKHGM